LSVADVVHEGGVLEAQLDGSVAGRGGCGHSVSLSSPEGRSRGSGLVSICS
jgi:hypothetical protein